MNTPALDGMNDIIAAPAASWWPLAPGWYAVAVLSIVVLIIITWALRRFFLRRRARRAAQRQLHKGMSISDINLLLKRACFAYFPESSVASLSGQQWQQFLLAQLSAAEAEHHQDLLAQVADYHFAPTPAPAELTADYLAFAQRWLRRALPPTKRQLHSGGHA